MKQSVHFSGEHLRLYRLHRIMHTKCIFSGTFGIFCTFCTLLELRAGNSNIVWLLMCWDNYSRIKNIKLHSYTAVSSVPDVSTRVHISTRMMDIPQRTMNVSMRIYQLGCRKYQESYTQKVSSGLSTCRCIGKRDDKSHCCNWSKYTMQLHTNIHIYIHVSYMMNEYTMYLLCGILSEWKTQNRAKIQNDTKCKMTNHPGARSARIQIYIYIYIIYWCWRRYL